MHQPGAALHAIMPTIHATHWLQLATLIALACASVSAGPWHTQADTNPCERFGSAPAVFVGEIGELTRHSMRPAPDLHPIEITALPVTVERSFRGVTANSVVYLYPLGAAEPGADAALKAGGRYLVSGFFNFGELKDLVMPVMVKPAEEAADDLAYLESVDSSSKTGSLSGLLVQGNPFDVQNRKPLPGITIRFRSRQTAVETVSDDNGRYSVLLPEGRVSIEPWLPDHLVGRETAEIRAGGCTSHSVVVQLNGRIRGRVLRPDASPMTWMVDLRPVKRGGDSYIPERSVRANKNGEYEFAAVPPGDYLVGLNLNLPPGNGAAFPATYYPGTVRREDAVAVTVGQGTVHEGIDFTLVDSIPAGKLEIRIQDPVGASSAVVCLQDISKPPAAPGGTYTFQPPTPLIIDVLEGSRYRLIAHVDLPNGHTESDIVELTGASGPQTLTVTATLPGRVHSHGDACSTIWLNRR